MNATPRYAPYFCEENVWQLLEEPRFAAREAWAVVITNRERQVAMWAQRAALVPGTPVVWDYHVVAVAKGDEGFDVFDLDCTEGCPLPFARWRYVSFDVARELPAELTPLFRVVDAREYRARFSSDRAHMRGPDGALLQQPPPWAPILPAGEAPNLHRFLDVDTPFLGDVLDLAALTRRFGPAARGPRP